MGNMAMVRDALEGVAAVRYVPDAGAQWSLVIVRPMFEQEARDSLRRQGVGTWWPNYPWLQPTHEKKNGRFTRRLAPCSVIPGTLFCLSRFDGLFWSAIDRAPGIINVALNPRGEPIVLSDLDIVLIHKIEAGLNTPSLAKPIHNFKRGEKVRLTEGMTARWGAGRITKLARDGRISLEVDLMGRKVTVTVLPHQIERM